MPKKKRFQYDAVADALKDLLASDHAFMGKEHVTAIAQKLDIETEVPVSEEMDTRWMFKGLTVHVADGFLDLHEFRKWMKENWDWIRWNIREKSRTRLVDTLWMVYTQAPPKGYGLEGVPYTTGIDATDFAMWLCRQKGVEYSFYVGRGFQLRECVQQLKKHFGAEWGEQ